MKHGLVCRMFAFLKRNINVFSFIDVKIVKLYQNLKNKMDSTSIQKTALVILDGWGINPNPKTSAIEAAETPFFDSLMRNNPNTTLTTFGEKVGLPEGQMGNSEVGHMNLGAGRVVYQELVRINKSFSENEFEKNPVFCDTIRFTKHHSKRIHLLGLLSDGGVHSHINHLLGLCEILKKESDLDVFIHAFLDGRDTDPQGGADYLAQLMENIHQTNIQISTVIGRYYAMDRDNRWERTKLAYDLLVNGEGEGTTSIIDAVKNKYSENLTDEFMSPLKLLSADGKNKYIMPGDTVIFFNFRTDRPRQLTEVLTQQDYHEYNMHKLSLHFVTFTEYDQRFSGIKVFFEKDNLNNTLGEVLSNHGCRQLRIAETEKYPHVTFFFNGGRETPYPGEERILVPSPKVATYDLQPEMSAFEITDQLMQYVDQSSPHFICLNYANTDMVGHTGVFEAAVKATEVVDHCLSNLIPFLLNLQYEIFIIADHGNSDVMVNPDGSPNTAHSLNPVPFILVTPDKNKMLKPGKLGDIAPTILFTMGLDKPEIMSGNILVAGNC